MLFREVINCGSQKSLENITSCIGLLRLLVILCHYCLFFEDILITHFNVLVWILEGN